ncbi:MAG: hypothetical protein M1839_002259 [Geoglossum umbratile]|nr:MAG: hypothetical protein M1839_002259 [Geoglossum umbratile]
MATFRASCHSPPELALSKLVSHHSFASSQHDVGATRIGRRKAPAQFPFRSSTPSASLDDDSIWGLVLPQSLPPPTSTAAYEAAWDAATSIPSAYSQTAEFSSSYSPEAITRECHLSTWPSRYCHGSAPPDPVPNPLCPEDHACIPVSWKGENRGKGVAVGDGSVCLLERGGMDRLQVGIIPIISHEDRGGSSQTEIAEKISSKPKREFPGREFRNDLDDGQGLGAGTDEVFWKKSTTRKPTPAAAWDWDRMSSRTISGDESFPDDRTHTGKETSLETRGERTRHTRASDGLTIGYIGRPNVRAGYIPSAVLPSGNGITALERVLDRNPVTGRMQERAIRRLKSVIGHLTGIAAPSSLDQQREMGQTWNVTIED